MIFQSTLPRGSDGIFNGTGKRHIISIHAPSRERLYSVLQSTSIFFISIHAPSRERLTDGEVTAVLLHISIHAPSRERHHNLN